MKVSEQDNSEKKQLFLPKSVELPQQKLPNLISTFEKTIISNETEQLQKNNKLTNPHRPASTLFASKLKANSDDSERSSHIQIERTINNPWVNLDHTPTHRDKHKSGMRRAIFVSNTDRKTLRTDLGYSCLIIPYRSKYIFLWDMLFQIILLGTCAILPIQVAFYEEGETISTPSLVLYSLTLLFYWIDIFLRMRTTFITDKFIEVTDPRKIMKNYSTSLKFFYHLASSVPLLPINYILGGLTHPLLMMNLCIRLLDLNLSKMETMYSYSAKRIWRLIFTIVKFMLIIHWITCIWYLLFVRLLFGKLGETQRWIPIPFMTIDSNSATAAYFEPGSVLYQYSFTVYSILMLMTGNDIIPTSVFQAGLSIVISIIGNMGLGFIFANISIIIQKINQDQTLYQEKLEALQRNLAQNEVPTNIRNRIYDYFDAYWQRRKHFVRFSDFSDLSEPLQRELAFHIHQSLIKTVPLFRELEETEIFSIIRKLQSLVYLPGDRIIREGDYGQEMFFINEGAVEVVLKKGALAQKSTVILKKGDHFGEIALISNSRRTSDVNCIEFCVLEKYAKQDYLSLQEEFPDIKVRLRKGLKLYKEVQCNKIAGSLENVPLFSSFSKEMIMELVRDYFEEKFIDPHEIILKPKSRANALYFILMGTVKEVSPETEDVGSYFDRANRSPGSHNQNLEPHSSKARGANSSDLYCIDDEIERGGLLDQQDELTGKILQSGDYFGEVSFDSQPVKRVKNFYIAESGCQILMLSQRTLDQIKEKSPNLYAEIGSGFKEYFLPSNEEDRPRRVLVRDQNEENISPLRTVIKTSQLENSSHTSNNQPNNTSSIAATVFQLEKSLQILKMQLKQDSALISN